MGCSFYFHGSMADDKVQDKIIEIVKSYFTHDPRMVYPRPDEKYVTKKLDLSAKSCIYPFNYYGIIPLWDEEGLLHHGQFVFDRSSGGRLIHFNKIQGLGNPTPLKDTDNLNDIDPQIEVWKGGYNRTEGSDTFALLLFIIKIRYIPELYVEDDYGVFRKLTDRIAEFNLVSAMKDEENDFDACWKLYVDECNRRSNLEKMRIEEIGLSICITNCLKKENIQTIGELFCCSESDLQKIPNLGTKSISEIKRIIEEMGLRLLTDYKKQSIVDKQNASIEAFEALIERTLEEMGLRLPTDDEQPSTKEQKDSNEDFYEVGDDKTLDDVVTKDNVIEQTISSELYVQNSANNKLKKDV